MNKHGEYHFSGYIVEKKDESKPGSGWEKVPVVLGPEADEATIPKLKEGNKYKFRVKAENKQGVSEPLEADQAIQAKNPFGMNVLIIQQKYYMFLRQHPHHLQLPTLVNDYITKEFT